MTMTIKRSELEVAFLPRDLRTVSSFAKHCEEHGVKVSKEELEYYDEQNLILPALFLDRGYTELFKFLPEGGSEWKTAYKIDQPKIKYQKLDPQRYYASIGLFMGNDGWLDHYPNEDKKIPARQKYVPWDTFTSWKWEVIDPKLLENGIEPLYSSQQLYPVAFITKNLQVSFKNRYLFRDAKSWAKTGGQVSAFMDELVDKFIRPRMAEYCVLINALVDIKDLMGPINLTIYKVYNDTLKLHGDEAKAAKEAKDERDFLFESKSKEAEAIIVKHNLSAERLSDMRTMLLEAGTFDLGWHAKKRREAYLAWYVTVVVNGEKPTRNVL